jgi:hypothetical protein
MVMAGDAVVLWVGLVTAIGLSAIFLYSGLCDLENKLDKIIDLLEKK